MNDLYLTHDVQAGLVWYYVLLAVMNLAFAAFLLSQPQARGRRPSGSSSPAVALMHAFAYFLHGNLILSKPHPRRSRLPDEPGDLHHRVHRRLRPAARFPQVLHPAASRLGDPQYRPLRRRLGHDRSQLPGHRHQAGQRADQPAHLLRRLLHLARPVPRRPQRRAHGPRRAGAGKARRRKSAGLARPRLHRADRAW